MAAPAAAATDLETLETGKDRLARVGEARSAAGDSRLGRGGHQPLAHGRLPGREHGPEQRLLPPAEVSERGRPLPATSSSLTNRRMRTRMSGGVRGGGSPPPPTRFAQ